MDDQLNVLYLYNSGVLISYKKEAVLIDGVFDDANGFDKMPLGYREMLLKKESLFDNVTVLLFTHCHNDHYEGETADAFADIHGDETVIAPVNGRDSMLSGDYGSFSVGSLHVEYLKTRHIFVGPFTCDNYVYKVSIGEKSVVITGDTEPESLGPIIDAFGSDTDAFLINAATFLYEMKNPESTLLKEISNLIVYHLPTEDNDEYGYRKAVVSIVDRAEQHLKNVKFLMENLKYIK